MKWMNAALRLSSFWEMKTSPRGRLPPDNVVIVPSCVVSPGRARSCPLVATWPEGRGSADPCVPRRPRQTQAPSHSYPAERKETHTQSEKSFRGDGVMTTTTAALVRRSYFTWGMPKAGGCQVTVTTLVQVSSAVGKKNHTTTQMKHRRERRGKEEQEEEKGGADFHLPKGWELRRSKGWSSVHMSQPCSSQPPSLHREQKRKGGAAREEIRHGFNAGHAANYTAIKQWK